MRLKCFEPVFHEHFESYHKRRAKIFQQEKEKKRDESISHRSQNSTIIKNSDDEEVTVMIPLEFEKDSGLIDVEKLIKKHKTAYPKTGKDLGKKRSPSYAASKLLQEVPDIQPEWYEHSKDQHWSVNKNDFDSEVETIPALYKSCELISDDYNLLKS